MKTMYVYSVYNSFTGDFLGSYKNESLEECRKWKRNLAKILGIANNNVYGKYKKLQNK